MADEIIKVIDELSKKFGIAINWSSENALPYIEDLGERIVRSELITSIIWILIPIILVIISILLIRKIDAMVEKGGYGLEDTLDYLANATIVLIIISIIITIFQILDIVVCLTIPEIVVFDAIQNLM